MKTYYNFDISTNEIYILIDYHKKQINSLFPGRNNDKLLKVFMRNCIKNNINIIKKYYYILKNDAKLK
jgi:hypothetical protein